MIIERNLGSWSEFRAVIDEIRQTYGYHEYLVGNTQTYKEKNIVLFRGQASTQWLLETTLERKTDKKFTLVQYLSKATKIVHELESYMGIKWNLLDIPDLQQEIIKKSDDLFGPFLPCYEYLVYLRHHGYPSPLLDWSESPYIAAYFAMCDAYQKRLLPDQRVAVFVYIESLDGTKSFDGGPLIKVKGPFVSTHKRHFIQKAWYTIAAKWSAEHQEFSFCSHHEIFDKPPSIYNQDKLIKITIPVADRKLALKDLDDYNINHFTLFQTEDSLIKALSIKNFDID